MNVAEQRAQGAKAELQAAQQLPGSCPLLDLFEDFIAFMGPCLEESIEQPARCGGVGKCGWERWCGGRCGGWGCGVVWWLCPVWTTFKL